MKNAAVPPRLALRLLDRFSGPGDEYGAAGDLEEYFRALAAERGARYARRDLWRQVWAAFPGYLKNVIIWSDAMLKHFVRVAFRNLRKHKGYSFINIAGLAIGLTSALFILLWIQDELSYDRFHANAPTLFRVEQDQASPQGTFHVLSTPFPLGLALIAEIPEIEDFARIMPLGNLLFRQGENAFYENRVYAVDPQFLQMFTFPLKEGDPTTALVGSGSLVINETIAKKYFGNADPMGQIVTVNNAHAFKITGILKNLPLNSTLSFDILGPIDFLKTLGMYDDRMANNTPLTYVRLHPRSDILAVAGKITQLVKSRTLAEFQNDPRLRATRENSQSAAQFNDYVEHRVFSLMSLVDVRLSGYAGHSHNNPARENVIAFGIIAFLVLLIAGMNFANLATARSANRALEIGLRKVIGARRKSLMVQHLGESILSSLLAGAVSLGLILLLLPVFNALSGKILTWRALAGGPFLLGMLAVVLLTGALAGGYPALFLSSLHPVKVLKGGFRGGTKNAWFRKTMVLVQFGLSILLLVCMGIVARQVDYMRYKNLGYDKEHLVYLPLRSATSASYAVLKEELLRNPKFLGVTAVNQMPTSYGSNTYAADWDGKSRDVTIWIARADFDYTETMKIDLAAGRPFSKAMSADSGHAILVNEEVPKLMGLDPSVAVGKRFRISGVEGAIVGVMKNFHFQSVRDAIEPLAIIAEPKQVRYAVIRLKAGEIAGSLKDIEKTWKRVNPLYPFEYRFFDEDFDRTYRADERMGSLLKVFTVMAVFIACLGLFGLASYTAEQRTKEIGVRKVLGASSPGIVMLLSKEFAKWVLAANLMAWPVGYFLMKKWLQQYAYNTGIAWWLFVAAGAGALAIALATVSFQAVRASRINPAVTLKYE
jgi:putative ABC transport system permease protein